MAASDVALNIVLKAQDETAAALTSATGNLSKMEKGANLASVAFHALTGVVAGELVGALSDAARRGADEEASMGRLKVAAYNTAGGFDASALALQAALDVAHRYGFATIEVNDSLALLTEQTGSADEAMKRIAVAEDLARGAHIDLYTASKLLGKATDENSSVLARYGVVVQKGADVTTMLADVEKKFGGQAIEYGNSTAGAIDRTTVAIDDWTAKIGNSLGPAQKYIALLPGLTSGVQLAGGAFFATTGLIGEHITSLKSLGVTLAVGGAVLIAIVAVGVALYEVGLTIQLVTDNWDKFVFALTTGKLSDIPVIGFFFGKIQMVLGAIQHAIDLWNALTHLFGSGPSAPVAAPNFNAPVAGFAGGGDFVTNGPQLIMVGEGQQRERVRITPAVGGGETPQTIITKVYLDSREIAQAVGKTFTQDRRLQGLA